MNHEEWTINQVVSAKLKEYRKKKGVIQKEVAEAVGVTTSTISHYEKAKTAVPIDILYKLLFYYEVSFDKFLDDDFTSFSKLASKDDLEVFKKYGLDEKFLQALRYNKLHHYIGVRDYDIAKTINLIFENITTLEAKRLFKNLDLFFDYELRKKLNEYINKDTPLPVGKDSYGRIFLNEVNEVFESIFGYMHNCEKSVETVEFEKRLGAEYEKNIRQLGKIKSEIKKQHKKTAEV